MSTDREREIETKNVNSTRGVLLDYVDISILEAEKRANSVLNLRDYFTAYLIETKVKCEDGPGSIAIPQLNLLWRRYSEFEQLQQYLQNQYPYLIIPPLPEKRHMYMWRTGVMYDVTDPDFVDRRRAGLENFLHRIAMHPILCNDSVFHDLLVKEHGWNVSLKQEGYFQIFESKFKELAIPLKLLPTNDRFDQILNYSKNLQICLDGILRIRSKVTEKLFTVDSLHANCGRLFSEWSVIEKNMGDGLQKAGHFIDTIPSSTETALQDEDVVADQLKEYLFFSSPLEEIYKHRVTLTLHISRLKESVSSKLEEKDNLIQGKSTIMARLFGALQTRELREEKIQQLDQRIQQDKDRVKEADDILGEFINLALADFNRFQNQKDLDIKQTLSTYVTQQIRISQRGLSTWINVKNCIEGIP